MSCICIAYYVVSCILVNLGSLMKLYNKNRKLVFSFKAHKYIIFKCKKACMLHASVCMCTYVVHVWYVSMYVIVCMYGMYLCTYVCVYV